MGVTPVLTPNELRILGQCPLHYHFQQQTPLAGVDEEDRKLDALLRATLQVLHAQGGPQRFKLPAVLDLLAAQAQAETALAEPTMVIARQAVAAYHRRLRREWANMLASNETLHLRLTLGRITILLTAEVDRLDRTNEGGITITEFKTGAGPMSDQLTLTADPGITALHALTAAAYPTRRPVRVRQLWLRTDEAVEVELTETEYRRNVSALGRSIQALVAGQFLARPGAYCDSCPFKFEGCPVYAHEIPADPAPSSLKPKPSVRTWSFIDDESDETE